MELVYLWVEEYKNIKNQGFNFSPRFTCKYENGELTIDKKEPEPLSIFPDNINVTAIVGENGSGKSSLLTGITNHKLIVYNKSNFYSNDFKGATCNVELLEHNRVEDYEILYLDFDLIKINETKGWWDYFNLNIYDKNLYTRVENGIVGDTSFNILKFRENFYNLIIEHRKLFHSQLFFFEPIEITLSAYLHETNSQSPQFKHINELIKNVQNYHLDSKERFLVFLYSNISMQVNLEISRIEKVEDITSIEEEILKNPTHNLENIKEIYKFFEALSPYIDKPKISIEEFSIIYHEHKNAFLKLIEIGYLHVGLNDCMGRQYFDLSQGERKLFTEMLMIFDAITKSKKDDIFLVLDEPDIALHPLWQKKYLNELIHMLSNFSGKKFHIIITSHSPFILSDLPKENIIFLEKGKQVYPNIETFGANIHTLLSHGFFMKEGLMGEFAKSKINKAIKYLNKKELTPEETDYCENIISIVGEPILKRQLQKMLDSKRLSEVEKIKQQIIELQQKLAEHQHAQN